MQDAFLDIYQVKESECGDFGNLLSRIFGKNFVKATFFTKEIV